jgi:hypothetical protein
VNIKTAVSCLLASMLSLCAVLGLSAFAQAEGADSATTVAVPADAGPPVAAAPAVTPSTPTAVPTTPAIVVPDPVEHPAEAYSELRAALKKSIPYGVVLALYMIFAYASSRAKPGSWLDKGRLPTIIAAGTSSLMALLLAMTGQTDWGAAMGAIVAAIFTTFHSDPPKKPAKLGAV